MTFMWTAKDAIGVTLLMLVILIGTALFVIERVMSKKFGQALAALSFLSAIGFGVYKLFWSLAGMG